MPLKISLPKIAKSLKVTDETARAKLKGIVFERKNDSAKEPRVYPLVAVLGHLFRAKKQPTEGELQSLFAGAVDDGELFVGDGVALALCDLLANRLPAEAQRRFSLVRGAFCAGLSGARGGAAYLPYLDSLQRKTLAHSEVLRYVILGGACDIDFNAFAPAFALVNARYEPMGVAA